jgi:hypothetical protein
LYFFLDDEFLKTYWGNGELNFCTLIKYSSRPR